MKDLIRKLFGNEVPEDQDVIDEMLDTEKGDAYDTDEYPDASGWLDS